MSSSAVSQTCPRSIPLVYITKTLLVIPQRGTASLKTRSRILSLRPRSLTTSTLSLRKDSSSRIMADWLSKVEPGINSTRISTSLFESASPLATEPKILTLRAPAADSRPAHLSMSMRIAELVPRHPDNLARPASRRADRRNLGPNEGRAQGSPGGTAKTTISNSYYS